MMNRLKINWLILQILLLTSGGIFSQVMYPGDANNSGVANALDVLAIGEAYGTTGPQRSGATTDWMPQSIAPSLWAQTFANGLNYAYADSNGDGVVDHADITEGVEANFLQEHTGNTIPDDYSSGGNQGSDPNFRVLADQEVLYGLDTLNVDIRLGTGAQPVSQFYGIAFTVFFDPALVETQQAKLTLAPNPWYDPLGGESDTLVVTDLANGRFDVGITRINQLGIDGSGSIGTMSFVIIEDVVGEYVELDSFMSIQFLKVVNSGGTSVQVYDTLQLKPTAAREAPEPEWRVYPNPARETVYIQTGATDIQHIAILNTLGQEMLRYYPSDQQEMHALPVNGLPGGAYFLELNTKSGRWVRKLIIPTTK